MLVRFLPICFLLLIITLALFIDEIECKEKVAKSRPDFAASNSHAFDDDDDDIDLDELNANDEEDDDQEDSVMKQRTVRESRPRRSRNVDRDIDELEEVEQGDVEDVGDDGFGRTRTSSSPGNSHTNDHSSSNEGFGTIRGRIVLPNIQRPTSQSSGSNNNNPNIIDLKNAARGQRGGGKSPTFTVTLNHGQYTTLSRSDGSFVFHDIPGDIYTLEVEGIANGGSRLFQREFIPPFLFPTYKLDSRKVNEKHIRCLRYPWPGASKEFTAYPLRIEPVGFSQYFEGRAGFNPFSLLRQPMVLVMLVMGGMVIFMPRMMENMDPEERKRLQQQFADQQAQQNPQELMNNFMAAWNGEDEEGERKKK